MRALIVDLQRDTAEFVLIPCELCGVLDFDWPLVDPTGYRPESRVEDHEDISNLNKSYTANE